MPKKTGHSKKLQFAIDFYHQNLGKIQDEHAQILLVLRAIEPPKYTTTCTPELSQLEYQHEKWFSDCKLNVAPAKDSLDGLKQIEDLISDLWLRTGATSPTPDADPRVALEAAQNSLAQRPTTENITSYPHTMALLIYSSRKALEYLARMFSLWVHIGKTHRGDLFRETNTKQEVLWCSLALCYEQQTWNALMR